MKTARVPVLAALLPVLAALHTGCGSEASAGESNSTAEAATVAQQLESLLEGITSPETAAAARTEVVELAEQLRAALPRMPTAAEGKSMLESVRENAATAMNALRGDLAAALQGIREQIERIASDPELVQPLRDAFEQLRAAGTERK